MRVVVPSTRSALNAYIQIYIRERTQQAARFVRFVDAFNIPIVTFVDVPGASHPSVYIV